MKQNGISRKKQKLRYVISDLLTGALAFWIFDIVRYFLLEENGNGFPNVWSYIANVKLIIEQCVVPPALLAIYWLSGYYNKPFNRSRLQEFNTTFLSEIVNTVIIYLVLLINDQTGRRIINYEIIIILFGLLFILTYSARLAITGFAIARFRSKQWQINVLIIGNSEVARRAAAKLSNSKRGIKYNIRGFVKIPGENSVKDNIKAYAFGALNKIITEKEIHQVILAPENHDDKKVLHILSVLFPLEIPVKISPDTFSFVTSSIRMADIYGEPFVDLTGPSIGEASKNIKRTFDVSLSLLILIILSPLYGLLSLLVRLSSKGPVFYKQERIGRFQKPFMIRKFRTMVENAEANGPQLSNENDKRITKVGHWMRKYRLDELPQFWNVLIGEMSIVGPRPEREFYIKQIVKEAPYYTLVCQVRPGITSWGMVKYGYASDVDQMVERTRYDLLYLANMSLSLDFKILIYTVKTVFGGEGV